MKNGYYHYVFCKSDHSEDYKQLQINDLYERREYCHNQKQYWHHFIESIKDHVYRKYHTCKDIHIEFSTLDTNDPFHRFVEHLYDICHILLRIPLCNKKSHQQAILFCVYINNDREHYGLVYV